MPRQENERVPFEKPIACAVGHYPTLLALEEIADFAMILRRQDGNPPFGKYGAQQERDLAAEGARAIVIDSRRGVSRRGPRPAQHVLEIRRDEGN
jgi:hypothetical protein